MEVIDYGERHEYWNVVTHAFGMLMCLILLPIIIYKAYISNYPSLLLGSILFSFSAFTTFTTSTLYHASKTISKRNLFRILDHISIYLLIGGTYSMYVLKYFNEFGGWVFMAIQWSIILMGIIFKIFFTGRFEAFSVFLYLCLGWMGLFIWEDVINKMSPATFNYLFIGGLSYTVGVFFYVGNRIPFNHTIWHLFVLAGCACHALSVYYCI